MNGLGKLDKIRMTVLVTDRTGSIIEAHGGGGLPLGYEATALVGRNALEVISPDDRMIMADTYGANKDFAIMSRIESFAFESLGPTAT